MSNEHMTISLKNAQQTPSDGTKRTLKRRFMSVAAVLLLLGFVAVGGYVFVTRTSPEQALQEATQGSTASKADDTEQVVERVGKLILLPDEKPTIAVVSDLGKLKGQKFFDHASQGDVVLMFARAQKAVLYNPTRNKVIEVAPITNDQ